MSEYFGIYDVKLGRWLMDGNLLIHYPAKEIAEAHVSMLGKNHSYIVKSFGHTYKKNNK